MRDKRTAYRILMGKPEGRRPLEDLEVSVKVRFKMNLR
jgi:hypothetical protein